MADLKTTQDISQKVTETLMGLIARDNHMIANYEHMIAHYKQMIVDDEQILADDEQMLEQIIDEIIANNKSINTVML